MSVFEKTVAEIVEENFLYGRALHHLGIDFFALQEQKLKEICKEKGLNERSVIRNFYKFDTPVRLPLNQIDDYPLPLLIRFLKHAHTTYIKEYLPYVGKLIEKIPHQGIEAVSDLKEVYPLFVEDFIHHIYEEEDEVFSYLLALLKFEKSHFRNPMIDLLPYFSISLEQLRDQHQLEDEMSSMRELIREIPSNTLEFRIVIRELNAFDRELLYHAEIEDQIMFPKAIQLEQKVWEKVNSIAKAN
jgi:regulator of cell morphogenesis and NO signaling